VIKGGAWNSSHSEYMYVTDRYGHPPRGRNNDFGFRCVLHF
jgi:formylglycine-generating enzyme required for sulfatase activity